MRDDEMPVCVDNLRFFAGAARCLEGKAAGEYLEGYTSFIRREPVGVVAQITPWNYPLMMAIWKIGPALATGNTIVLKPAETTPLSTIRLAELANEILPPGVLNIVTGAGEVGQRMVTHPDVDMVSLTGSVGTGKWIAQGRRGHAQARAPGARRQGAGGGLRRRRPRGGWRARSPAPPTTTPARTAPRRPACSRPRRMHDDVVEALAEQARALKLGDTFDPETTLGPVNSARQLGNITGFLERRPDHARIVTGGNRPDSPGFFLEPTVIDGLRQDDEMVQREIFGPVITVQRFDDEDKAIEWANGTPVRPREQRVDARHRPRAAGVARRCASAACGSTTTSRSSSEMPHGGFKESGYGKDLSMYGLEDYTVVKHVMASLS